MSITILGLGAGDPRALTLEAHDILEQATEIYLRTRDHPTVAALPPHLRVHTFDHLYESRREFDAIYSAIADAILALAVQSDVIYAVPGHPFFGEIAAQKILTRAREKNIPTRIVQGISFVDAACAALALDPLARGLQIADATDFARRHFPTLDPDQPALIGQLHNRATASDCKLTLLTNYPPDHSVTLIHSAGTPEQNIEMLPLAELDRNENLGVRTTLYVPPLPQPSSLNSLAEIVAHLRAPEGCPWDREQTHQSLRKEFLEEAYEVLDTLDRNDMPHLREELGDLLLHVLLQTQIASESSEFLLSEVVAEIWAKLVRRHPHVFGDANGTVSVKVSGTDEIIANWERIKKSEKQKAGGNKSNLPRALPALARAQKIAKKISTNQNESTNLSEIAMRVGKLSRARNREQALGNVLFALAAFASSKGIDAESALRAVTNKQSK